MNVKDLIGKTVIGAEYKYSLVLEFDNDVKIEVSSRYEGGIDIEYEAVETVTQKVTKHLQEE